MLLALAVLTSVVSSGPVTPPTGAALLSNESTIRQAVARINALPAESGQLTPPLRRPQPPTIVRHTLSRRLRAVVIGMVAGMAAVGAAASVMPGEIDDLGTAMTLACIGAGGGGILGAVVAW